MRDKELDGLRAIAVAMVVAWHAIAIPFWTSSPLFPIVIVGRSGVDLFFVLSGFLITRILLRTRDANARDFFGGFYIRRAFRILPPYAALLAVFFIVRSMAPGFVFFSNDVFPIESYLTFTQNIAAAWTNSYGASLLSVTWSLALEEQFYLLFPLLVWLVPVNRLPLVCWTLVASALILRAALIYSTKDDMGAYVLLPCRTDGLAIGALIAFGFVYSRAKMMTWARGSVLAFAGLAAFVPLHTYFVLKHPVTTTVWSHTYLAALYGCGVFATIAYANAPLLAFLRSRIAGGLATISYTLYLVHTGALTAVPALLGRDKTDPLMIGASLLIAVGISAISHLCLERHAIRYGRRLADRVTRPVAPALAS